MSSYEQDKQIKELLENKVIKSGVNLKSIYDAKGGLTPDHIKFSPDYRKVKLESELAIKELREFNKYFVKKYKKEIAQERKLKRQSLMKVNYE